MRKIFLVTAGDYSSYCVLAAYSDRAKAEAALARGLGEEVEEIDLDPELETIPGDLNYYFVTMKRDGTVTHVDIGDPYAGEADAGTLKVTDYARPALSGPTTPYGLYDYEPSHGVLFRCFARDKEHAIKIVNEKRAQMIAQNTWPSGESPIVPKCYAMQVEVTRPDIFKDGIEPAIRSAIDRTLEHAAAVREGRDPLA